MCVRVKTLWNITTDSSACAREKGNPEPGSEWVGHLPRQVGVTEEKTNVEMLAVNSWRCLTGLLAWLQTLHRPNQRPIRGLLQTSCNRALQSEMNAFPCGRSINTKYENRSVMKSKKAAANPDTKLSLHDLESSALTVTQSRWCRSTCALITACLPPSP